MEIELECKMAFTLVDTQARGSLEFADLQTVLNLMGYSVPATRLTELEPEYASFDLDKLVGLVKTEFANMCSEEELLKAFRQFDQQGAGKLQVAEFKNIMQNMGETMGEQEISEMIAFADKDNTGTIDYVDFSKRMIAK